MIIHWLLSGWLPASCFRCAFEVVMCPAEPFPQVRNLVVLGLKLRRLSLQFGLELR